MEQNVSSFLAKADFSTCMIPKVMVCIYSYVNLATLDLEAVALFAVCKGTQCPTGFLC